MHSKTVWLIYIIWLLTACTPATPPPPPLTALLAEAESLADERHFTGATNVLEQAAQFYPDSSLPLIKMGQIHMQQARWLLAVDAFNRALARDPDNPVPVVGLAEVALQQQQYHRARALWQQLIHDHPDLPGSYTGLGQAHLGLLAFEAAVVAFETQQSHTFDPEAAWYLAALTAPHDPAQASAYLSSIADAPAMNQQRQYLQTTLEAAGSPYEAAHTVGVALAQIGQWELAAHALEIAVVDAPTPAARAESLAFLGHVTAQMGRPATDWFTQALEANPNSALVLQLYGLYLREQGNLREAEAVFRRAMMFDGGNAAIYAELGQTKTRQGDLTGAAAYYQVAAVVAGDDLSFRLAQLRFYASHSFRLAEAGIPAAEKLLALDADNAEGHALLGWMQFLASGSAGEESLRRALELDPDLISGRYFLARYLEDQGRYEEALVEYQKVIDWDTSNQYRHQAIWDRQRLLGG